MLVTLFREVSYIQVGKNAVGWFVETERIKKKRLDEDKVVNRILFKLFTVFEEHNFLIFQLSKCVLRYSELENSV